MPTLLQIFQGGVYRVLDDDWCPNIVKGVLGDMAWVDIPLLYKGNLPKRVLLPLNYSSPETGFLFELSPNICDFTITEIMAGVFNIKPVTWVTTMADPYGRLRQCAE